MLFISAINIGLFVSHNSSGTSGQMLKVRGTRIIWRKGVPLDDQDDTVIILLLLGAGIAQSV